MLNHVDWSHGLGSDLIACSLGFLGFVNNQCLICGGQKSVSTYLCFVLFR